MKKAIQHTYFFIIIPILVIIRTTQILVSFLLLISSIPLKWIGKETYNKYMNICARIISLDVEDKEQRFTVQDLKEAVKQNKE